MPCRSLSRRSQLMQDAVPSGVGAMAAIIGLDDAGVSAACDEASALGVAEPVNFNSPGQVVIAGHKEAIEKRLNCARPPVRGAACCCRSACRHIRR